MIGGLSKVSGGMAFPEKPPSSIQQGVWMVPQEGNMTVE